jgi:hypothetical protein
MHIRNTTGVQQARCDAQFRQCTLIVTLNDLLEGQGGMGNGEVG